MPPAKKGRRARGGVLRLCHQDLGLSLALSDLSAASGPDDVEEGVTLAEEVTYAMQSELRP